MTQNAEKIFNPNRGILTHAEVAAHADACRTQNLTIGFTNGIFDLLHSGHISSLEQAKNLVDVLFVGVNSNASTIRLKGPSRPIVDEKERMLLLAALRAVDAVTLFDPNLDTADHLIEIIKPDIYIKGGDYTAANLPEAKTVHKFGGTVEIIPRPEGSASTTDIITRCKNLA